MHFILLLPLQQNEHMLQYMYRHAHNSINTYTSWTVNPLNWTNSVMGTLQKYKWSRVLQMKNKSSISSLANWRK